MLSLFAYGLLTVGAIVSVILSTIDSSLLAIGALAAVALLACLVPAWRAAREIAFCRLLSCR